LTGYLKGRVISDETGVAIHFASVALLDSLGQFTNTGAYTKEDGSYVISGIPAGTHSVGVSMMGFDSLILDDIIVTPGDTTRLDFKLIHSVFQGPYYHKWPYSYSRTDSIEILMHALNNYRTILEGRVQAQGSINEPWPPLQNVSLTVIDSNGVYLQTARSGPKGFFKIWNLAPGIYSLLAEIDGYLPEVNESIPIEEGWMVWVAVVMSKREHETPLP